MGASKRHCNIQIAGITAAVLIGLCRPSAAAAPDDIACSKPTDMVIGYGALVACNITPVGGSDMYRFQGAAGEVATLQVANANGSLRPIPCVELFGPSGTPIGGRQCTAYGSRITAALGSTGTHTIRVSEQYNASVVPYALSLERVGTPPSPTAKSIGFSGSAVDDINPAGDVDMYRFEAVDGAVVRVTVANGNGSLSPIPCVELYGPSGTQIGTRQCTAYGSKLDATLTAGGTYAMRITEQYNASTVPYTLTLDCLVAACTGPEPLQRMGVLTHLASGGGWKTTMMLVNLASAQIAVRLNLWSDDGTPLTLPLSFPQTGEGSARAATIDRRIPANGSVIVETESTAAEIATGWVEVLGSGPVSGFAIFRSVPEGRAASEGTVPLQTAFPSTITLPYDNSAGFVMGVALANVSTAPANVTATIWDDAGSRLGSETMAVASGGHVAFVLPNRLPLTTGRRGIVRFQSTSSALSGIGLRFSPFGTFTSVPMIADR